jgi:hypothetical protein
VGLSLPVAILFPFLKTTSVHKKGTAKEYTLVFYAGNKPLARLEIPDCEIRPLSTIHLRTSYVCDLDEIVVDGVVCHIITVEILY